MNDDVFYKAMLSRDYRFDGKFFIGVKTTGIYCRPICPARPKRKNITFYLSANEAEGHGFRPCMRCRPECAPLSPAWIGKSAVVQRALRIISNDGTFSYSEDEFAEKFGMTARHLRRLFKDEVGQTPKQIAINNRLNFSRKLISESNLKITIIAMTAGYSSIRRFNDDFKKRFLKSPREFRRSKSMDESCGITFSLSYRPPFNWQEILNYYRVHNIAYVETVTKDSYERVFKSNQELGYIRVKNNEFKSRLDFQVLIEDTSELLKISQKLRNMFDLDSDPIVIANCFESNEFLDKLWNKFPGLRIARGWDPFEQSICTILGQLVSLKQARSLIKQLVESYGETVVNPLNGEEVKLFPTPKILSTAKLSSVKTTEKRRKTIRDFSKKILNKTIILSSDQDYYYIQDQLLKIDGIGPWTAKYILLRALGDPDVFPGSDLILKRAMEKHKNLDLNILRPWRSYAAIYLWMNYAKSLSKKKVKKK
ncbi:helix-turn-helix domain-containing protein [Bacteriovoracaceae bacterium]|nr:helix-turn-helix domain-containing protein [Bacteriovoracaceae bacterium]